jgi:hypothetical protein
MRLVSLLIATLQLTSQLLLTINAFYLPDYLSSRRSFLKSKAFFVSLHPLTSIPSMSAVDSYSSLVDIDRIEWFDDIVHSPGAKELRVKEWDDETWRLSEGGFSGVDFCHSKQAAVRIVKYAILPPHSTVNEADPFPRLIGATHFTSRAESHRGLCHGGSFCALMDDAIGWLGFCISGKVLPWSGYTVQVNTSLKKSVPVGSLLRLESWVNRRDGKRKLWIHARLSDPHTHDVHCEGNGLFLLNPEHVDEA